VLDLNIDLGELPDEPEELYALATVVNVACGGHAGDDVSMHAAVRAALAAHARIAAHPGYADREGFGRRARFAPAARMPAEVQSQCAELAAIAAARGGTVKMVKPHGALYHDAATDPDVAVAVLEGARAALGPDLVVVGPPAGALREAAERAGHHYVREGFADRGLDAHGGLLPRGTPGALIEEPAAAAAQALDLARRGTFETLCVHGDTPGAVAIARAVRRALEEAGCLRRRG
jgi:UPF0271 protein